MFVDQPALLGVAVIALVVLGQVPLVAYLSRYVALDATADRPDPSAGYVTYGTTRARPDVNAIEPVNDTGRGPEGPHCPHCNASVDGDAGYEYCGECAGRLPRRVVHR